MAKSAVQGEGGEEEAEVAVENAFAKPNVSARGVGLKVEGLKASHVGAPAFGASLACVQCRQRRGGGKRCPWEHSA